MKRLKKLCLSLCIVALLLSAIGGPGWAQEGAPPPPAPPAEIEAADVETTFAPASHELWGQDAYYDPLALQQDVVFWAAAPLSCAPAGVEFPQPCQIRSRPANGVAAATPERLLHNAGSSGPFIRSNLAVDESYVYWIGSDFNLKRLPRSASPADQPTVLGPTGHVTPTLTFSLAVDANYLFWTESIPTGTGRVGRLYRMLKTGAARQLMQQYAQPMSQVRADGAGGAYFISPLFTNLLLRTVPAGSGFNTDLSGAPPGVAAYALDSTHVYWVEKITNLVIKRAPRNNIAAVETLENRGNTGNPTAPVIAVDATNVYWQETRSNLGPVYRRSLTGGAPQQVSDNLTTAIGMASNGRYLFWNGGDLYRLPVNASTWTLDLTAGNIEVIQAIQRPANDVPLVSGKETFVRVFPRILSSNPVRTTVPLWPNVVLYGTRGGNPLPESPLSPVMTMGAPTAVSAAAADRRDLNSGVWFRLPASWADGTVQLRAVVNPRRVQPETSYANNEASLTAAFNRKAPICLDMKPVATERGTTVASWPAARGSVMPFFNRALQLLPTHDLRILMRGGDPLRKPRWYLVDSDPFGLSRSNADSTWMLMLMNVRTAFEGNPCPDGGDTIRTVMAQDFPDREVNGLQAGNSLLFFAFWEPSGGFRQNVPGGGVTLAHEIGHYYGRGHINCPAGVPDGVDGGYPYPPCQLDNTGANEHIAFDSSPLSAPPSLLLPETTGDLLSYAHHLPLPRWPSDYTWRSIFNGLDNRLAAVAGEAVAPEGADATVSLIVTGFLSGSTAELRETFQLTDPLLGQVTAQIAAATVSTNAYRLRAYNGAALLADQPLRIIEADYELNPGVPRPDFTGILQRLDLAAQPTRVEVVQTASGAVLATLNASPNPPSVAITSPAAGSQVGRTLTVAWNASDPDGGILHHMVRYSADNGATWTVLGQSLTGNSLAVDMSGLPGGANARVQVITTDGLRTAIATSGPFAVQKHSPEVDILFPGGTRFNHGEVIVLRGRAYDPEDGFLTATLQWQVAGQVNAAGDGEQFTLLNLPPGAYTARFTAADSDGNTSEATAQFVVAPKRVEDSTTPVVDGYCEDAAYAADPDPIVLHYNQGTPSATSAQVRLIRSGGFVYACFSGLPLGTSAAEAAILKFDVNNSADAAQQAGDLIFLLQRDGVARSGRGNGTATDVLDAVPQGLIGAISTGATSWSAEMRITASRLGDWGKLVRMLAAHDSRAAWPRGSVSHEPRTWGLTGLGLDQLPGSRVFMPLVIRN